MRLLRHQRSHNRHQLRRRHVIHRDHPGHGLPAGLLPPSPHRRHRILLGVHAGNDLGNILAGNSGKAVHIEHGEKHLIDLIGLHRPRGDHRHPPLDPRVDNKIPAGHLRHGGDNRIDIGILEIQRHRLGMHPPPQQQQTDSQQQRQPLLASRCVQRQTPVCTGSHGV